ncbi:Phosphoribosylaminoimidazole-succinocarboxamide synthase [Carex littledalei]|uniref:Phosphoribosylaminoimidazole-succinocarboxamide synthase n=1 Tax=Carex littledalei TaxID=544730 RepID=A0A833RCK8_9POAL|nr:Phosphoribosylaminoimidazole-succinocarboxamide synthase [Carex littledalei]
MDEVIQNNTSDPTEYEEDSLITEVVQNSTRVPTDPAPLAPLGFPLSASLLSAHLHLVSHGTRLNTSIPRHTAPGAAREVALEHGLLLVDTKYEFEKANDGTIMLIDEVLPDAPVELVCELAWW